MPVSPFTFGLEPEDLDAPIWRFLEFWKFQDLMKGHIYFHRADLYEDSDPQEGLPLDKYENLPGRHRLDINDIQERNWQLGFDAQIRQSCRTHGSPGRRNARPRRPRFAVGIICRRLQL